MTVLRTILLLALTSACGCTTTQTVPPHDLQAALESLQPGDRIALRAADAWQENVTVVAVTDASVQIEDTGGARHTVARSEIDGIRVRVSAPGKTAGLAVGIFFGVLGSGIPGLSL